MKAEDLKRLLEPYGPDRDFREALGLRLGNLRALRTAIESDVLDVAVGVSWWQDQLPETERALVSDHLVQCLVGIPMALGDAELHRLEYLHALQQEQLAEQQTLFFGPNGEMVNRPRRPMSSCAADDLPGALTALHLVGFFRALVSALDCLGGTMVGVLGLPIPLLTAGFSEALKELSDESPSRAKVWTTFHAELNRLIEVSGPPRWREWIFHTRQCLIHRPRPVQISSWEPTGPWSGVVSAEGSPVRLAVPVPHLPIDPARSELDRLGRFPNYLGEPAEETLEGARTSVIKLVEGLSTALALAWAERKGSPSDVEQPLLKQWPRNSKAGVDSGFSGFTRAAPLQPDELTAHPDFVKRLKAASKDTK